MKRFKSFVFVDALVTLPFFVYAIHEILVERSPDPVWIWIFFGCGLAVMLPSLVCLVGLRLPQILSVILIILYLVLMLWMGLMFLSGLHGQIDYSLARAGVILVVAKSIYGVCMVTKQFD